MSAKASTATRATKKSASSAAEFKKRKKGAPLELPSGLIVVARRVELRAYLFFDRTAQAQQRHSSADAYRNTYYQE